MGRLLALDLGRKRCGVAVTDPLRICANGLPTVNTNEIITFLHDYFTKEQVDSIIIGEPKDLHGNPSDSMRYILPVINKIKKDFPEKPVIMFDERFTSAIAHQEMLNGGFKKKDRQQKERADEMAAVLILTSYLESRQNQ